MRAKLILIAGNCVLCVKSSSWAVIPTDRKENVFFLIFSDAIFNMHKTISLILFSLAMLQLAGCAKTSAPTAGGQMGNLLLAEPMPVSPRSQLAIVRYNQVLASAELEEQERAGKLEEGMRECRTNSSP